MKKDDEMYGLQDAEELQGDIEEVLERVIEDAVDVPGEPIEKILGRIAWPIRVLGYRRMVLPSPENLAHDVLERTLESLDEEHSDPDGDGTEPSEGMKAAALAFGRAVIEDYVSWACEPSGAVIEFTREQILKREREAADAPKA